MADIYEREQSWRQAAQVLVGIPLETGQKQYTVDYKLETYLKIARLYLEDEDPVQKNYQNRAAKNNVLRPGKTGKEFQILNETQDDRIRGGKSSSNFSNDSTSTASNSHHEAGIKKPDSNISSGGQKGKQKAMFANKPGDKNKHNNHIALNLQSASESQNQDELDVSGPENDLVEDDFWN